MIMGFTYFDPMSSSATWFPSIIENAPMPGRTKDLSISVPVAVALIRHTLDPSKAL